MKKIQNLGGRPSTKNSPALLLYCVLEPVADGKDENKWVHLKCDTQFHENKASAKALLFKTIEKKKIEHPVEYKVLILNENKILKPVITTKFVEEDIPTEIKQEPEPEQEPNETEDDLPGIEEPTNDD